MALRLLTVTHIPTHILLLTSQFRVQCSHDSVRVSVIGVIGRSTSRRVRAMRYEREQTGSHGVPRPGFSSGDRGGSSLESWEEQNDFWL